MSKKLSLDMNQAGCVCAILLVIVALMVYAIFFKKETFEMNPYPIPDSGMERDPAKMKAQVGAAFRIVKFYNLFKRNRIIYWRNFQNVAYGAEDNKIRLAKEFARRFNDISKNMMTLFNKYDIDANNMNIYTSYGGKIPLRLRQILIDAQALGSIICYDRVNEVVKRRDDLPERFRELGAGEDYLRNALNDLCYIEKQANINYPTYRP